MSRVALRVPGVVGANWTETWQLPPLESDLPVQPSALVTKSPAPVPFTVTEVTWVEPVASSVTGTAVPVAPFSSGGQRAMAGAVVAGPPHARPPAPPSPPRPPPAPLPRCPHTTPGSRV